MKWSMGGLAVALGLVAFGGCEDVVDLDPIDERAPVEPRVRPKPISGGTLAVMDNGDAVAADPDRDVVHVVDVPNERVRHTIALEPGDEPGRVAEGSAGLVHVVLRGFGGVATIDLGTGTVTARHAVCPDPRGLAFDASDASLRVACADGTFVHMTEAGEVVARTMVTPDLRDVLIVDGYAYLSTFRAASVVDQLGNRIAAPAATPAFEPRVAWHTRAAPDGRVVMLHQMSGTNPVPIEPPPEETGELPYGGGGGGVSFCQPGISNPAVTIVTDTGALTTLVAGAHLAVDAALEPGSDNVVLAMPGAPEGEATAVVVNPASGGCTTNPIPTDDGQVTAVAFDPDGTLVMQSREPARLLIRDHAGSGSVAVVELGGESSFDTGHEIFHRATESGLSCASCHPEGTDDGHVWVFDELGKRRTQPLDVGLEGTAPFHWDGDMTDLDVLMDEVLSHRMGGNRQSSQRRESFTRWLFEQQRPPADSGMGDPALVSAGASLFAAYGCATSCHLGDKLGGGTAGEVRGAMLQVPSLRRVALRPPFMHDGRATTLEDAVLDMIVSTTPTADPAPEDVEAISAYLRTL